MSTSGAARREVRRELVFIHADDPCPTEFAWYDDGTRGIPDLHLGRWTGRVAAPGETPELQRTTGGRITRDDLHGVTVIAAQQRGWKTPESPDRIGPILYSLEATGGCLTEDDSAALARLALAAVRWLNEHVAPAGREFVLTDALYLVCGGGRRRTPPKSPPDPGREEEASEAVSRRRC